MILKEFRELRRDRRTMAMLIALPIILLVVFGYAANFNIDTVETAVIGPAAQSVSGQLPELFDVTEVGTSVSTAFGLEMVRDGTVSAVVDTSTQPPTVYVDGSNIFTAQPVVSMAGRLGDAVTLEVLYNPDLITAWILVPPLTGLILMFIGVVITAIGLVRERENGTLEQLAVMPIKPSSVIVGKIAPYFLLASIDMIIVTILGTALFNVPFVGSVALFALGAALFLFVVLGLGVLISTASQNAGQAIQMALFVLLPQILLSGMIFPLDAIPWGVRWISFLLPLTYYTEIAVGIMLRSADLVALAVPFGILGVMSVVVFSASVLRFRRDLAPNISHVEVSTRETS
jgi:ABC-2 type transport system permease protein